MSSNTLNGNPSVFDPIQETVRIESPRRRKAQEAFGLRGGRGSLAFYQQAIIAMLPVAIMLPAILIAGWYWSRAFLTFEVGGKLDWSLTTLVPWLIAIGVGAMSYLGVSKLHHARKMKDQGLSSAEMGFNGWFAAVGVVFLSFIDVIACLGGATTIVYGDQFVNGDIFAGPSDMATLANGAIVTALTPGVMLLYGLFIGLAVFSEPIARWAVDFADEKFGSGQGQASLIERASLLERELESVHSELVVEKDATDKRLDAIMRITNTIPYDNLKR